MTHNQKRNVRLHIKQLVLDGFSSQDKNRVASVVQQEIHHLLGQRDLPRKLTQNGDIPNLDAGTIQIQSNATAKSNGSKIARSLYKGLQR